MRVSRLDNSKYHLACLWDLYKDPECEELFRRMPRDLSDAALAKLEEKTGTAIYLLEGVTSAPLGFMFLSGTDPYSMSCEFGLGLLPTSRGKRNAAKITTECISYLFKTTMLNKITLRCLHSRNDIKHLCKENGMTLEGVYEDNIFFNGEWQAEISFSVTRKQFTELMQKEGS